MRAQAAHAPADDLVPFETWLAQGEVQEIPWDVRVSDAAMSMRQWPVVRIEVRVPGSYLRESRGPRLLTVIARVADERGQWITPREELAGRVEGVIPGRAHVTFPLVLLALPGRYQLGVVLYDHATGRRSVGRRAFRVKALRNDPLPGAWRNLPRASFLQQAEFPDGGYRLAEPGDLWLPVKTRRPLRIELLVNFSLSEQFAGSVEVYRRNRRTMLAALDVLSQLDLERGSLHLTAVDLFRQRVLYEQEITGGVDWPALHAALQEVHPLVISAEALENQRRSAAFFRQLLRERIERAASGQGDAAEAAGEAGHTAQNQPAGDALPVFLVVSSGILFPAGSDLEPLAARDAERCDCRVFYLQFRIHRDNLWDRLSRLLSPLRPRRYFLESPEAFRKALGGLLRELRNL